MRSVVCYYVEANATLRNRSDHTRTPRPCLHATSLRTATYSTAHAISLRTATDRDNKSHAISLRTATYSTALFPIAASYMRMPKCRRDGIYAPQQATHTTAYVASIYFFYRVAGTTGGGGGGRSQVKSRGSSGPSTFGSKISRSAAIYTWLDLLFFAIPQTRRHRSARFYLARRPLKGPGIRRRTSRNRCASVNVAVPDNCSSFYRRQLAAAALSYS